MRIHHLNCGSFCPLGGHFTDGMTPGIGPSRLVCHCLLIESEKGLILVDTGLGLKDVEHPRERLPSFNRKILRPTLSKKETAHWQIKELGYQPKDVTHIVLTHLDFDHAGGLDDFPYAEIHVMNAERRAASNRFNFQSRNRYSPSQISHSKYWNTYYPEGERWFGFQSVRDLEGLPPEILLIPLFGHTEGHAGVAVQTDQGWLLHAGDAYFYRGELEREYNCPPILRGYQKFMEADRNQRLMNQKRLRELSQNHPRDVAIFSAHDAIEYLSLKEGQSRFLYHEDFRPHDPDELAGLGLS